MDCHRIEDLHRLFFTHDPCFIRYARVMKPLIVLLLAMVLSPIHGKSAQSDESQELSWATETYAQCEASHGNKFHCQGCNSVELLRILRLDSLEAAMQPVHPNW